MHCGESFEQHALRDNERWCRDGQHRFNCEFQINPEVVDFVKAYPDKSGKELADLWIERMRKRKP
jgi:hypothetical protein